jgi:hypothetical protein
MGYPDPEATVHEVSDPRTETADALDDIVRGGIKPTTDMGMDITALLRQGYDNDPWFALAENVKPLELKDGLWWRNHQLMVPDDDNLKRGILYEMHDAPYSGHGGFTKTYRAVNRRFSWPNMKAYISESPAGLVNGSFQGARRH